MTRVERWRAGDDDSLCVERREDLRWLRLGQPRLAWPHDLSLSRARRGLSPPAGSGRGPITSSAPPLTRQGQVRQSKTEWMCRMASRSWGDWSSSWWASKHLSDRQRQGDKSCSSPVVNWPSPPLTRQVAGGLWASRSDICKCRAHWIGEDHICSRHLACPSNKRAGIRRDIRHIQTAC